MVIELQLRYDTAANWTAANPILKMAEKGLETDTMKWKTGDGVTHWTSLAYETVEIPIATTLVAGLVKIGTGLNITPEGVLSNAYGGDATTLNGKTEAQLDVDTAVTAGSANTAGVLTGAGTNNSSFQIDADNSGPIESHKTEYARNSGSKESRHAFNGAIPIDIESGRAIMRSPNSIDKSIYPYVGDDNNWATEWTYSTTGNITVNFLSRFDYGQLATSVTVTAAGATVTLTRTVKRLRDLHKVLSMFSFETVGASSTFTIITESAKLQERRTWAYGTVPSAGLKQLNNETPTVETGVTGLTGEKVKITFGGLPAGSYNVYLNNAMFYGTIETELTAVSSQRAGDINLQAMEEDWIPGMFIADRQVLAGTFFRVQDMNNPDIYRGPFGVTCQKYSGAGIENDLFNITEMTPVTLPGKDVDVLASLEGGLFARFSPGIGLGAHVVDEVAPFDKKICPNPTFDANATGWSAVAGSNLTINTQAYDGTVNSPWGTGGSFKINVTVTAGQKGSLEIWFTGCKRLRYINKVGTCLRLSVFGSQVKMYIDTWSELNNENFSGYDYVFGDCFTNTWNDTAFINQPMSYYGDSDGNTGERFALMIGDLPEGTYDVWIGGIAFDAESIPMITNAMDPAHPNAIKVTSKEADSPVELFVENNIVPVFRGASATAPTDPMLGHMWIDTSGTPALKIHDGTTWQAT